MFSIKLKNGRSADLKLTIGAVDRIKSRLGIDLLDADQAMLEKLFNPRIVAGIISILAEPELERLQISPEDIPELFDADSMLGLSEQFFEELCRFFVAMRRASTAHLISKALKLENETNSKLIALIDSQVDEAQISDGIVSSAQLELQASVRKIAPGTN